MERSIALVLDFDDTLSDDTKLLDKVAEELLINFSVRKDIFRLTYELAKDRKGIYQTLEHSRLIYEKWLKMLLISERPSFQNLIIQGFESEMLEITRSWAQKCVFPDVWRFFKHLKKNDSSIAPFILSKGEKFYQGLKIRASGIADILGQTEGYCTEFGPLPKVIVTDDKKGFWLELFSACFDWVIFVDDKPNQHEKAHKYIRQCVLPGDTHNLFHVWMNRSNKFKPPSLPVNFYTIKSLNELSPLISNILKY